MKNREFLDMPRREADYRPKEERVLDYREVELPPEPAVIEQQAKRCMNCGIPFCHGSGCPLENQIPEINRAAAEGRWSDAWALLNSTSSFPEFTSLVCPAPCEGACTNGLNLTPVTIRRIEYMVTDRAFADGLVIPRPPALRTGKSVAVVGSGPAGLAAAHYLNKFGHLVTVYEANRKPGGLLRYGIPDFKLEKRIIDRRIEIMIEEGIEFVCSTAVGADISLDYLRRHYDAVVVAAGTPEARELPVPGRELSGIYPALAFLTAQNRRNGGEPLDAASDICARGKRVVVIGGGDTGSDCVGTANRQGAAEVTQIEIMPKPPEQRSPSTPWPQWPYLLRTGSSHKEGCRREWSVATRSFSGVDGRVSAVNAVRVEWEFSASGKPLRFSEVAGSEFEIGADLVLLALGFTGFSADNPAQRLGLALNGRSCLAAGPDGATAFPGVFACGDAVAGPSLVVRALVAGHRASLAVDRYLKKQARSCGNEI